jgi:hypothetical protein
MGCCLMPGKNLDPASGKRAAWESVLDGTAPPAADATDEADGNQPRTFANGAPMRLPAQPSLAEQAAAARARSADATAWARSASADAEAAFSAAVASAGAEQSDEDAADAAAVAEDAAARARLATSAAAEAAFEAAFEAAGGSEAADAASPAWAAYAAYAAAWAFTAYGACAAWAAGEQSDEDAAADLVATARASYECSRTAADYLAGIVSDTVRQYQAAMTERGHAAAVLAAAELAQARLIQGGCS